MDKTKIVIVGSAFGLCLIIVLLVLVVNRNNDGVTVNNTNNINNNSSSSSSNTINDYIVIDNSDMYMVSNNNFTRLSDKQVVDQKFYTYINGEYYGIYNLKLGTNWNLFDDNNHYVNYNGELFAYTNNFLAINIRSRNIDKVNERDINDINNEMNTNIDMNDLLINEKMSIDIDSNGIIDDIISVSNAKIDEGRRQDKYFNLLYVNLNGRKIILIKEDIPYSDLLTSPCYSIHYLLNINNIDSLLILKGYFSSGGKTENILYQYKNNNFVEVID